MAFGVVVVGSLLALFGMLEFDERCAKGLTPGPGGFQRVRYHAFPPATICEFTRGEVSSLGGHGVLNLLLWASMLIMVGCLLTALLAECLDPRLGGSLVVPMTRTHKLRRTRTAFFVLGSAFLMVYALDGWSLFAGPSSACAAGGDWGSQAPKTLDYSFFPPQATCRYASGLIKPKIPDWMTWLAVELAVPAALAGIGFGLAWRRWRVERRVNARGTPKLAKTA